MSTDECQSAGASRVPPAMRVRWLQCAPQSLPRMRWTGSSSSVSTITPHLYFVRFKYCVSSSPAQFVIDSMQKEIWWHVEKIWWCVCEGGDIGSRIILQYHPGDNLFTLLWSSIQRLIMFCCWPREDLSREIAAQGHASLNPRIECDIFL